MAKQYAVVNRKSGDIRGLIVGKDDLKNFEKQRSRDELDNYFIHSVDNKISQMMIKEYMMVEVAYGFVLFPDEYELVSVTHNQFIMDVEHQINRVLRDIIPFLKLTVEEEHIVFSAVRDSLDVLLNYEENALDEEDVNPEEVYFNMHLFTQRVLKLGDDM